MNAFQYRLTRLFSVTAMSLLAGCAQLIVITPDSIASAKGQVIQHKVGLYISPADLARETRHPRGAGDTVTYLPYRDLAAPIYAVLRDSFSDVSRLDSADDSIIRKDDLTLLFVPRVCRRRSKSDPPRRSNIDPGMDADRVVAGCGQV